MSSAALTSAPEVVSSGTVPSRPSLLLNLTFAVAPSVPDSVKFGRGNRYSAKGLPGRLVEHNSGTLPPLRETEIYGLCPLAINPHRYFRLQETSFLLHHLVTTDDVIFKNQLIGNVSAPPVVEVAYLAMQAPLEFFVFFITSETSSLRIRHRLLST